MLFVPMLSKGVAIGTVNVTRPELGSFSDEEIGLLKTFADQAVIAIENTRLFEEVQARTGELQESLEYQTATSDVLNIINRSTTEVQPVFDAIVKSAARLFDPCMISIVSLEGHQMFYRTSASARHEQNIETFKSLYPMPFDPERRPASCAILEKRIVEIPDAAAGYGISKGVTRSGLWTARVVVRSTGPTAPPLQSHQGGWATDINRVGVRTEPRQGNSRRNLCGRSLIDARPQSGTAPDEKTEMR